MADNSTQENHQRGEEDAAMRRKFPNAAAGRSALLEKRLSRGGQKFFDSGDYNLAKAAKDPKHKNKLNLGYPLAMNSPSSPTEPKSAGVLPTGAISPLIFSPVNPLTPPSTPITTSFTPSATDPNNVIGAALMAELSLGAPARPPSSIDYHHRRLSRQQSRLACEIEAIVDAARKEKETTTEESA